MSQPSLHPTPTLMLMTRDRRSLQATEHAISTTVHIHCVTTTGTGPHIQRTLQTTTTSPANNEPQPCDKGSSDSCASPNPTVVRFSGCFALLVRPTPGQRSPLPFRDARPLRGRLAKAAYKTNNLECRGGLSCHRGQNMGTSHILEGLALPVWPKSQTEVTEGPGELFQEKGGSPRQWAKTLRQATCDQTSMEKRNGVRLAGEDSGHKYTAIHQLRGGTALLAGLKSWTELCMQLGKGNGVCLAGRQTRNLLKEMWLAPPARMKLWCNGHTFMIKRPRRLLDSIVTWNLWFEWVSATVVE
ncbi:hypothetical protein K439DRAFT_1614154 [Ramaria rubella]|nr:hypothetical protein K439DRAFT_1614154 [Ramaria rubella]